MLVLPRLAVSRAENPSTGKSREYVQMIQRFLNVTSLGGLALMLTSCTTPAFRDARLFARDFDRAQLERDIAALRVMTADDLVFVPGSGSLQGKREFIDGYAAPTLRIEPFEIINPTYVQLGRDAAVVGGEVVLRGSEDGKAFASHFRFADTFVWRDGRWQAVHIQVTSIPAKREADR
jgi:hypothetical protein